MNRTNQSTVIKEAINSLLDEGVTDKQDIYSKVTEGMDAAHKIENLPRDGNDCPKQEAKMLKVTISE